METLSTSMLQTRTLRGRVIYKILQPGSGGARTGSTLLVQIAMSLRWDGLGLALQGNPSQSGGIWMGDTTTPGVGWPTGVPPGDAPHGLGRWRWASGG